VNTSVAVSSTAATPPIQRSSQLTAGVRTNVSRTARANGTSSACAQDSTLMNSTKPANTTTGFTTFAVSSMARHPRHSSESGRTATFRIGQPAAGGYSFNSTTVAPPPPWLGGAGVTFCTSG
jgi:hypothetical protein